MDRPRIDEHVAARLIAAQFPHWAHLPVRAVLPGGNDNRTFRLGDDLAVRLPSAQGYVAAVAKEQRWLPVIARHVRLPVPEPVGFGRPGEGYPFPWTINRWMPGTTAQSAPPANLDAFAEDVADFLRSLNDTPTDGAPLAGEHSFWRGAELAHYDEEVRRTVATLGERIDRARATALWDDALAATWTGPPVWFHGDVASGNLLVQGGRLSAVIDFGTSGVGDPACDLYLAWTFLDAPARRVFRRALGVDDAMWSRGRAWALWKVLITYDEWGRAFLPPILTDPH